MSHYLFRTLASEIHNTGTDLTHISLYEEHCEGRTDEYQSITAHAQFSNFSHEELRVMDYQQGRCSVGADSLTSSKSNHAVLLDAASGSTNRRDRTHLELYGNLTLKPCTCNELTSTGFAVQASRSVSAHHRAHVRTHQGVNVKYPGLCLQP
jgi:hypothetical protein